MEQVIKLTGRIAKAFPTNSGVSQRTGNPWMSQDYLLEFFSWSGARYPDRVVFRVFGEDRIKQFNLQELEDNVTVVLRMDAHESDGRWFNEISATNVIRANIQQTAPSPQQDGGTGAAPAAASPTTGNAPSPQLEVQGNPKKDDLPF